MINAQQRQYIHEALELIDAAGVAYTDYLQKGNLFREACLLWDRNDTLVKHLGHIRNLLPEDFHSHIDALLHHLGVWREKWIALKNEINPENETIFIFQNTVTFPRDSAAYLKQAAGG